ncbi:hypothetical protein FQR65_LT07448 [Abscondita terminalis]|nr:hypothetical protein FQR65_LT07448 [Abscondita terminalis]
MGISAYTFERVVNLKILYLEHNRIAEIHPWAFNGLFNLNYLYLNNNSISGLVQYHFKPLKSLVDLQLRQNLLSFIDTSTFNGLKNIKYLYLGNNNLNTIKPYGLIGLNSLEDMENLHVLWLEDNNVINFTISSHTDIQKSLRIINLEKNHLEFVNYKLLLEKVPRLDELWIGGNNWTCDFIIEMQDYFFTNNVTICTNKNCSKEAVKNYIDGICFEPYENETDLVDAAVTDCTSSNDLEKYLTHKYVKQSEATIEGIISNTIVFEPTMIGKKKKKVFKLNVVTKPMNYVLKRDPELNPIYRVFEMSISSGIVKPGDCLTCTVTYKPLIVDQKSVDYFQIIDNDLNTFKICIQGESIGPNVGVSIKNLFFYKTCNGKNLMRTFEIRNIYCGEVHFCLDANEEPENQELFKIDKVCGVLSPCSYTYITISFEGTRNGFYFNRLFCRVENHAPLLIKLFAIVSPTLNFDPEHVDLIKISDKYPTTGFDGYMFDVIKSTVINPPFSLSSNYLDFGSVIYQDLTESQTLVTSLTNHLTDDVTIIWMNDNEKVFSISPKKVTLPPNESVLFECSFKPDRCDHLYNKIITAQVLWGNFSSKFFQVEELHEIYEPLNISLILSGRSFPADKMWLPMVEMKPDVVVLPPTMPKNPSYSTVLIKSFGSLPTYFKFIPPKTTNYLLKPMQGIVYDFQVIVIQLQPDGNDKKAYVERCGVELNGRSDNCVEVFLKCVAENIAVTIGDNNSLVFNNVQPGCQDTISASIHNKTVHSLKYNFLLRGDYFTIDSPQAELASNEFVNLNFFLTGNVNLPELFSIKCRLRNLSQIKMVTGNSVDVNISVYNRCIYSELCSTPSFYDFGNIEFGSKVSASFYLFNFGESPLHFQLLKKETEGYANNVKIVPTIGTITPQQKMKISISVKGTAVGDHKIEVAYQLRLHRTSNIIVDQYKARTVFTAILECTYATVQISDIRDSNFGFLFTKLTLWNMINIDELNNVLANIKPEETQNVEISLPEYEIGEAEFYAKLVLRNITNFSTKVKFKWKKNCECKPTEKTVGLSMREKTDECVHKTISKLSIESEVVKPNSNNIVQLDVKYLKYDLTVIWYTISLAYKRTVNVFINVSVLPEIVTMPSKYFKSFDFDLQSVFIGEQEPPAQAYPIYNNSAFNVKYEISTAALNEINFHYDFEVFYCLNPSETLPPFTSSNILLRFHPISTEIYTVTVHVPIKMGDEDFILNITGTGSDKPSDYYDNLVRTSPALPEHSNVDIDVNLSSELLVIKPFQVWMGRETMIFIRNQSNHKLIGYSWQNTSQKGVAFVQALRTKGLLYPKESHAIPLQIIAFDQPCILSLTMTCKLIDHSQHIRHKESVAAYHQREQEIEGHFTITEKGTFYPKNEVEILSKPEVFFTTLTITVCIISKPDRDIYISLENQLEQIPQRRLKLDVGLTFIDYCDEVLESIEKRTYFRKILNLQKLDFQNKSTTLNMFKMVIESIFADIIHSEVFKKYLQFSNNLYQPYYCQCVIEGEVFEPLLGKKILKKKRLIELKKHLELVKSYLNAPQSTTIEIVLKSLINESIHNAFQLKGRVKPEKGPFEYSYGTFEHKFRCPICQCKH